MTTKAEKQHLAKVAELGCIICKSPAEIHHLRMGMGMGQRNDYKHAIGLCHVHHRTGGYGIAIHAGQKEFEKNFGSEEALLHQVERLLK